MFQIEIPGFMRKRTKKCAMKMKRKKVKRKKRNDERLNIFDGRKELIRRVRKTRVMDIKRLQVNDSSYIEGTICLVNK